MSAGRWWLLATWMLVIGAVPWLCAAAGADARVIFAYLCHQLPERTLHLEGEPMALCSRCAGIFLGLVVGALAAPPLPTGARAWLMGHGRTLVVATVVLNLVDWAVFQVLPLSHQSRLVVGAAFGAVSTAWMLTALRRRRSSAEPAPDSRTPAWSRA